MKIGIKKGMDNMRFQEIDYVKRIIEIHERQERILSSQIEFNDKQIEFDRFLQNKIQYLEKKIKLLEKQIKEKKNE